MLKLLHLTRAYSRAHARTGAWAHTRTHARTHTEMWPILSVHTTSASCQCQRSTRALRAPHVRCTQHAVRCTLHAARLTPHALHVHRTLHSSHCLLHTSCCPLPAGYFPTTCIVSAATRTSPARPPYAAQHDPSSDTLGLSAAAYSVCSSSLNVAVDCCGPLARPRPRPLRPRRAEASPLTYAPPLYSVGAPAASAALKTRSTPLWRTMPPSGACGMRRRLSTQCSTGMAAAMPSSPQYSIVLRRSLYAAAHRHPVSVPGNNTLSDWSLCSASKPVSISSCRTTPSSCTVSTLQGSAVHTAPRALERHTSCCCSGSTRSLSSHTLTSPPCEAVRNECACSASTLVYDSLAGHHANDHTGDTSALIWKSTCARHGSTPGSCQPATMPSQQPTSSFTPAWRATAPWAQLPGSCHASEHGTLPPSSAQVKRNWAGRRTAGTPTAEPPPLPPPAMPQLALPLRPSAAAAAAVVAAAAPALAAAAK
mmetsp:Transcript_38036/g.112605  ORF Transcript_38036/g.112605 Transcript_38036/m.112605 type:complete len:481 (+) Transcript_38036:56-1498(+)